MPAQNNVRHKSLDCERTTTNENFPQAKIAELRDLVTHLEGRVVSNRPCSREILPPMDGTSVC